MAPIVAPKMLSFQTVAQRAQQTDLADVKKSDGEHEHCRSPLDHACGDAFAPVVGFVTELALGAAIESVFMQRKEFRLPREDDWVLRPAA